MPIKVTFHYDKQGKLTGKTVTRRQPKGYCGYCGTDHKQELCQYAEAAADEAKRRRGDVG